jgi:hypothetical protein
MYTPKKLKWNSLSEFKEHLVKETSEKIILFDGWRIVTETTEYGIIHGILKVRPKQKIEDIKKLETLGNRVKIPLPKKKKKEVPKAKSKQDILAEMRERGKKALEKKNRKR